jgi:Xaa-Pro aminopeptidase
MSEIEQKEKMLREYMRAQGYDGILMFRRDTFSWITGGRINHIIRSTEFGMMALLITAEDKFCVANQVEKHRMMEEEDLAGLGYTLLEINWWEEDYLDCIRRRFGAIKIGSDKELPGVADVYDDLKRIRYSLMLEEIERYRELCTVCTNAVEDTCREIKQGDTEHEVLANMIGKVMKQGIEGSVALVASDERIFKYRHPIDTEKKIDRYAMVVLCGRKYGLIANLTRFIHFGPLPEEISRKFELVRKIDTEIITNTIVGRKIKDVFQVAVREYEEAGYKDEWTLLHQGGPTGYATRDFLATPDNDELIYNNQAFTWNPSITGTKSEDTILVSHQGFEVLTDSKNWPMVDVKAKNGLVVKRPDVLIR